MYEFSAGIHSNIALSTIRRSPMYSIKRFPNPYLNTFVFPLLRPIFSVPLSLTKQIDTSQVPLYFTLSLTFRSNVL